MKDQVLTMSPEEAASRALVARTSFEKEAVRLLSDIRQPAEPDA